tara:strand:- start:50 stop:1201 length:1152 start_codon:yes stop_codon:yes gene_type:complete
MKKIFYNKQFIDNSDVISVKNSLKNELITNGPKVKVFENILKKKLKSKFALVCNSGTSALHLALMAVNIKKGDIVIIPSINFISSFAMLSLRGAKIYLADVSKYTGQSTPELIEECIKKNKLKKVDLIITMFLGGSPYNVVNFFKLKKKYNCFIIEDACHALGASYIVNKKNYKVGSCKHCDISTFSFHPVKTITTGEGGALTTNNNNFYKRAFLFRSHGIIRNEKKYYEYQINELSNNYRLSDINCSLGISQILKLDKILKKRKKLFQYYSKKLKEFNHMIYIPQNNDFFSSYHLFLVSFKNFTFKKKIHLIKFLNKNDIYPQFHYIPLYKFKAVKSRKSGIIMNKGSEYYYSSYLSLPLFYDLKLSQIDRIVKLLKKYFSK